MSFDSSSSFTSSSRRSVPDYPVGTCQAVSLTVFLTGVIIYLLLFHSLPVEAWGSDGHEIVANIAYRRLSNSTRTAVNTLLMGNSKKAVVIEDEFLEQEYLREHRALELKELGITTNFTNSPLAKVANWADHVRYTKSWSWTAPLHFIDVQDTYYTNGCHYDDLVEPWNKKKNKEKCKFVYDRDCKNDFCAAGAISNYSNILEQGLKTKQLQKDKSTSVIFEMKHQLRSPKTSNISDLVQDSLKFITHFIGDIHQPLHCARESDLGGNIFDVNFDVPSEAHHKWNLHSVWDTGIIIRAIHEIYNDSRDSFEKDITNKIETEYSIEVDSWLGCHDGRTRVCPTMWGEESLNDALQYAYRSEEGFEIDNGSIISYDYYISRLVIIQKRLAMAGVRLAATLELIFEKSAM